MADNTTLSPGAGGDVIATDDIAGVKYQRVKLSLGADGAATDVPIGQQAMSSSIPVAIASDQTVPVSGTVTANTGLSQPLTDTQLRNSPVPVSGTFYQATQPISGTVTANISGSISNTGFGANQGTAAALSGKWPVQITDGTNTMPTGDAAARTIHTTVDNASIAVTGTFWQTTQPVSISSMPTTPVKPDGSVWTLTGTSANANITNTSLTVAQATPANLQATVTPITLTKGTQGATGFSTQDLKDAGRTSIMITASVASSATSETLITITRSQGLAATGTSSSTTITSGKKLRIQTIVASARNSTGTTAGVATIKIRGAVNGATSATSPLQYTSSVALPAAATTVVFPDANIPDGFEIDSNSGTNTYGVTITHPQWVTGSVVATFDISIIAYEY